MSFLSEFVRAGIEDFRYVSAEEDIFTLDDGAGVLLNLCEDASDECIRIFFVPGYLAGCEWLKGLGKPWQSVAQPVSGDPAVSHSVSVDPRTGLVLLTRSWPRHTLDAVRLREAVLECAAVYRFWRDLLLPMATEAVEPMEPLAY